MKQRILLCSFLCGVLMSFCCLRNATRKKEKQNEKQLRYHYKYFFSFNIKIDNFSVELVQRRQRRQQQQRCLCRSDDGIVLLNMNRKKLLTHEIASDC